MTMHDAGQRLGRIAALAMASLWIPAERAGAAEGAGPAAPPGPAEIIFAARPPANHHYYENFGRYVYHVKQWYAPPEQADAGPPLPLYTEGARLCRLDLRTGRVRVLLDDPRGGVRDPQVHYDGRKILFSYRPGGEPHYHLYEIQADGTGLVRRTGGPYDDIEPIYLPDGRILFCSSRCRRYVGCNPSPVATLYACDGDGRNVRPLSASPFTDNTPWMLPDGRVLFTRWEYVDRNQMSFHHLWTMNPDGTGVAAFFGNQYTRPERPPPRFTDVAMLDAKPVPGTNLAVASFSPGHGRPEHLGHVTLVDPGRGPDHMPSARTLLPKRMFRDPYPLDADRFLAADAQGIWLLDAQGGAELLYRLPDGDAPLECHEPRPLQTRAREPVVPVRAEAGAPVGRLLLRDVYRGRNMAGVARGEIKQLLVLEQLPKPVQFSGGQEPLTIGGSFTLNRVLGTVPVEPDGSAHFEAPALRAIYFAALDENGLALKPMRSFTSLMPGETAGCVGCHEERTTAAPAGETPLAAARPPSPIAPFDGLPDVFDYPRDVQPVLDRLCVECHHPDRPEGRIDLCADRTPMYSRSYWTLISRGLVSDGRNYLGDAPPRAEGSAASRLLKLMDGSHYGAKATKRDREIVRLWIDSGAVYPGTYAALGSGISMVQFPHDVAKRRCAACHAEEPKPYPGMPKGAVHYRFGEAGPAQALVEELRSATLVIRLAYYKAGEALPPQALCNLSRPEKSPLVRAPLARAAGGLELCAGPVFRTSEDADYQAILAAVRKAASELEQIKRFDVAGFRPNKYYVRLMQEYGVLPGDLAPDAPVDPYAADRAYWRSLRP